MNRTITSALLAITLTLGFSGVAEAASTETAIIKCSFKGYTRAGEFIFLTRYSDGTSPRIGVLPGIGNKALYFKDRKEEMFIELAGYGSPIKMYTIYDSGKAYLSYHPLTPMEDNRPPPEPSQVLGKCSKVF